MTHLIEAGSFLGIMLEEQIDSFACVLGDLGFLSCCILSSVISLWTDSWIWSCFFSQPNCWI